MSPVSFALSGIAANHVMPPSFGKVRLLEPASKNATPPSSGAGACAPICTHATSSPDDLKKNVSAFSPSLSCPPGTAKSTVVQPFVSLALMSLLSFARRLIVPSSFENARSRTVLRPASAAVSGTNTVPDLPVSRATLMSFSACRSSHARLPPLSWFAIRVYFAKPAEPASTTSPPPRRRCADSRLSTSEYTACSAPRDTAFTGAVAGGATTCFAAVVSATFASTAGTSLGDLPQAQTATIVTRTA